MFPPAVVLVAIAAVLVLSLAAALLPLGPAKALVKLIATSLMGVAMSVYGLMTVVKIARAPRVSTGGVVRAVQVFHGKGAHTEFDLDGPDGPVSLHLSYSGAAITEGDQAIVRYVGGMGTVTHMEMLSGANSGWSEDANDGTAGAWMAFGVGVILVLIAFWNNARYPDGASGRRRWF
jgi:hypothetical protein